MLEVKRPISGEEGPYLMPSELLTVMSQGSREGGGR